MKKIFHVETILAGVLLLAITGCSKKDAATTTPTPTAAETPAATAAAPAATTGAPAQDASKYFAEADAALKAKAYDQAVKSLLAAKAQKNLSDQQAALANQRIVGMQRDLAAAVAAGDPAAKAAAELIRQSTMH